MLGESCEGCVYHMVNHWVDPQQHICIRTMEAFAVRPSSILPCIDYTPKPIYIPKRGA